MDKRTVAGRAALGGPESVALIEELITGIGDAIDASLRENESEVAPEHLAGCVLSALGTAYYRLACRVVAMTDATPEQRAVMQEHNRAAVLDGLHKMCHGISLVGDVPVVPKPNRLLN